MYSKLPLFWRIYVLIGSLTCFTISDYLLTKHYLGFVGDDGEANPIMRWVIINFGIAGVLAVKLIGTGILALLVPYVKPKALQWVYASLLIMNVAIMVVTWMGFYAVSTTL